MNTEKEEKKFEVKVSAVGDEIVYGYGITCLKKDEEGNVKFYEDSYGDVALEGFLAKGMVSFMENHRTAKAMHDGEKIGEVVYGFPLTSEIAEALKIGDWDQTGFLVGMKPNKEVMEKFKSGEYTGFSLGGYLTKVRNGYAETD